MNASSFGTVLFPCFGTCSACIKAQAVVMRMRAWALELCDDCSEKPSSSGACASAGMRTFIRMVEARAAGLPSIHPPSPQAGLPQDQGPQ
eukprot:892183-Alexandrium_andersonii.AAC.1